MKEYQVNALIGKVVTRVFIDEYAHGFYLDAEIMCISWGSWRLIDNEQTVIQVADGSIHDEGGKVICMSNLLGKEVVSAVIDQRRNENLCINFTDGTLLLLNNGEAYMNWNISFSNYSIWFDSELNWAPAYLEPDTYKIEIH